MFCPRVATVPEPFCMVRQNHPRRPWFLGTGACGIVVPRLLCMQKASGSITDGSIFTCRWLLPQMDKTAGSGCDPPTFELRACFFHESRTLRTSSHPMRTGPPRGGTGCQAHGSGAAAVFTGVQICMLEAEKKAKSSRQNWYCQQKK